MKTFDQYQPLSTGFEGHVTAVAQGWVRLSGLEDATMHELVIFENNVLGYIISMHEDSLDCIVLSNNPLTRGMQVRLTGRKPEISLSQEITGKIVTPLGESLTTSFADETTLPIFHTPAGLPFRSRIHRACFTGVKMVDLLLPLGKGQRELVIGDRKTGKTNFLLQSMRFQMEDGAIGIYAAIGKKKTDIKKVEAFFASHGLHKNVIIVASSSDDPAGMIYLTPYTAMTIAEYFRDLGKDVILILDDLTTHAKFYREISLIANRFPGRNSYPSDIFSVHANLLERAGNFKHHDGSDVSITCLPVAETLQGDISGYIQTNIMSMTDGHLLFDEDLFAKNRRPAINPFLSVTRVGRQTQDALQREITNIVLTFLDKVEKLEGYTHFGAELHEETRAMLRKGQALITFFSQERETSIDQYLSLFSFAQVWNKDWNDLSEISQFLTDVTASYNTSAPFQAEVYRFLIFKNKVKR
jgi:F-type H+-transporting ATPase subunit alpha